jgi:WD40 repeat protein
VWDLSVKNPFATPGILEGYDVAARPFDIWFHNEGFSPDSRWYVVQDHEGRLRLWDLTARELTKMPIKLKPHGRLGVAWKISADSHWLAVTGFTSTTNLWDLTAPNPSASGIILRGHEGSVLSLAFTPDSRRLITCSHEQARVWNLNLNEVMAQARETAGRELTPEERQQYSLLTPEDSASSENWREESDSLEPPSPSP